MQPPCQSAIILHIKGPPVTVVPSFAKITANFSGVGGYFFESLFDSSDTACITNMAVCMTTMMISYVRNKMGFIHQKTALVYVGLCPAIQMISMDP